MKKQTIISIGVFIAGVVCGAWLLCEISWRYGIEEDSQIECSRCGAYRRYEQYFLSTKVRVSESDCSKWVKKVISYPHYAHRWAHGNSRYRYNWFSGYAHACGGFYSSIPNIIYRQKEKLGEKRAIEILNEFHKIEHMNKHEIKKRLKKMNFDFDGSVYDFK
jgi:hypothetical protein